MSSDIKSWLENLNLGQYASVFVENDIEPDIVVELSDADLKELGVSLGHRKRILRAAAGADAPAPSAVAATRTTAPGPRHDQDAEAERRQLTVMFCDLVDSTGLSVRVDPEDLRHIIGSFQKCCERVVEIFGGRVARYMGDGALVYFGYPTASEHDPERAIRAGLELVRAVNQISVRQDIVLQTRVGIATGEVVVGDLIGEGVSQEHAVVGETPNLAARLQGLAEPDTVVVAHTTRSLVGGLFEYRDLGSHTLKGFESPVRAWHVEQELDIESRFEATHSGEELPPLLGRESETNLLLERWTRARDGTGQAVLLLGEAGIGKSRLSQALRDYLTGEAHALQRFFCVPYHQKSALFPIIANIERASGIARRDKPELRLRKIEHMVAAHAGDLEELVPIYAALLSVPLDDRYPALGMSPRLQKEKTLQVLQDYITRQAREQPLLVLFEDLHWVDPTTMEWLGALLERLHDLPVLILMTARPEFMSPWPEEKNFTTIHLEKLGEEFVRGLIRQVTAGKDLPDELVVLISEKTDGVPLFVEELTKTMLESGQLVESEAGFELSDTLPELLVPNTLQDSLLARLDRLGAGKKLAQVGAAIGRSFSYELVARVVGERREELELALERLAASGLVFRKGEPPRSEYLFKHALVQDAAYSTLLKERRLALHKAIAETMELYFPQLARREPEMLAHHYSRAEIYDKAIPHWELAARQAIERAAHEEAQRHLNTALNLLEKIPDGEQKLRLELDLQLAMGLALESARGYAAEEVEQAYDRARGICEQLEMTAELVPVLLGLYVFNFVRGNFALGRKFVDRSVEISKVSKRLDYLIESYAALGFLQGHQGEFAAARETLENVSSLYDSRSDGEVFTHITAQDPSVACRVLKAIIDWDMGEVEQSELELQRGLALAADLGHSIDQAVAWAHAAEYYSMRRDFERAMEAAAQGLEISQRHGHDPWLLCSMMHMGIAQSMNGNPDAGLPLAEQGLAMWRAAGARVNSSYFLGATAYAMHLAGREDEAATMMEEAFEVCEASSEYFHLSTLQFMRGRILMAGGGNFAAAEAQLVKAVETAAERGALLLELRALTALHELRVGEGRGGLTESRLRELVEHFAAAGDLPDLADARAALAMESKGSAASQPEPAR